MNMDLNLYMTKYSRIDEINRDETVQPIFFIHAEKMSNTKFQTYIDMAKQEMGPEASFKKLEEKMREFHFIPIVTGYYNKR